MKRARERGESIKKQEEGGKSEESRKTGERQGKGGCVCVGPSGCADIKLDTGQLNKQATGSKTGRKREKHEELTRQNMKIMKDKKGAGC